jgi:catalase
MAMRTPKILALAVIGMTALLQTQSPLHAQTPAPNDLAQQIFDTMIQVHGVTPGHRPVHAKGIVCEGTFVPTKDAATLSKAAHFQAASVPVTVRFSDGAPDPIVPDNAPNAGPRGMAIRFKPAGGTETDIIAMSHNGFVISTGEEFLALQKSIVATDPSKPHPWPVEAFLGAHPLALKFVEESAIAPASFGTQPFFSNDSFTFIAKDGTRQIGRYKIIPLAGEKFLTDAESKAKSPDFLIDDLKARLPNDPIKFRLVVQLPNTGDPTNDPSLVWPEDRKTLDLGTLTITSVVPDTAAAEKALAYDPTNLTDGIELSDDPIPTLRSQVYALSVAYRNK